MNPDLDKVRDRDYPERCQQCYLVTQLCVCTKRYRVPAGFHSLRRIRAAVWN